MCTLQKYLHESRHLHALKRVRGFSGRFSGKQSDKELLALSEGSSLLPQKLPSILKPVISTSSSNEAGGTRVSPNTLKGYGLLARGIEIQDTTLEQNLAPESCTTTGSDLSSLNSHVVSLALDQLGASSLIQIPPQDVISTTVSSCGDTSAQSSLSDVPLSTTVQGLLSAAQGFSVSGIPLDITPTTSTALACQTVSSLPDSAVSVSDGLSIGLSQQRADNVLSTVSTSLLEMNDPLSNTSSHLTTTVMPDSSTPDMTLYPPSVELASSSEEVVTGSVPSSALGLTKLAPMDPNNEENLGEALVDSSEP